SPVRNSWYMDSSFHTPSNCCSASEARTGGARMVPSPEIVVSSPTIRYRTVPLSACEYGEHAQERAAALEEPEDRLVGVVRARESLRGQHRRGPPPQSVPRIPLDGGGSTAWAAGILSASALSPSPSERDREGVHRPCGHADSDRTPRLAEVFDGREPSLSE